MWLVVSTNSGGRRTSRFPSISSPRLTKNRVVKTGDVSWFETFRTCDAAAVTRLSPYTWPLVPPVSGADHVKVDKASKAALKTEAMKAPNCGKGRQKRLQSTHTGHYTRATFVVGGFGMAGDWWCHTTTCLRSWMGMMWVGTSGRHKRYGFGCGGCIINPDAR